MSFGAWAHPTTSAISTELAQEMMKRLVPRRRIAARSGYAMARSLELGFGPMPDKVSLQHGLEQMVHQLLERDDRQRQREQREQRHHRQPNYSALAEWNDAHRPDD